MTTKSYSRRSIRVLGAGIALLGLLGLSLLAQPVPEKFLQCNSDINLSFTTANPVPGGNVVVRMQLVNGPSNDAVNAPLDQSWTQITYFPDCTAISATNPPVCTVNPTPRRTFVGIVPGPGTACASAANAAVQPDGSVVLTFTPSPLVLPAAATSTGTTTCSISLDTLLAPTASGAITGFAVSGVNVCSASLGLNTFGDGSQTLTVMPVMDTVALVVLALTLMAGAIWMLLRRPVGGTPA